MNHPCLLLKKFLMAGRTGPNLNLIESIMLRTAFKETLSSIEDKEGKKKGAEILNQSVFIILLLLNCY